MAVNPEAELIARISAMVERMNTTNQTIRQMVDEVTATIERIDGSLPRRRHHLALVCDPCECAGANPDCPRCYPL